MAGKLTKLPKLSENEWKLLEKLREKKAGLTLIQAANIGGCRDVKVTLAMIDGPFADYVGFMETRKRYLLTNAGMRVLEHRDQLLDPNTLADCFRASSCVRPQPPGGYRAPERCDGAEAVEHRSGPGRDRDDPRSVLPTEVLTSTQVRVY